MSLSIYEKAGTKVEKQGTVSEVFKESGLDWEVVQRPIHSEWPSLGTSLVPATSTGFTKRIPSLVANYRSDDGTFLGVVHPKTYKVVQNVDAFDFINDLNGFTYDRVGTAKGGKEVFVVGKANDDFYLDGNTDQVQMFLTFMHAHNGKKGIRFLLTPIRTFCCNQLNLLLETAMFSYSIAHTGKVEDKITQVKIAVKKSQEYMMNLEDALKDLINEPMQITIEDFTKQLVKDADDDTKLVLSRKSDIRDNIINTYKNKDDLANYQGTAFGFLSAVSDVISHQESIRSNTDYSNVFLRNIEGNPLLTDAYSLLKVV